MTNDAHLYIGTCSWKYPSWKGLIYPESGPFQYLEEYAKHYNTVEIDQWFWSLFPGKLPVLPNPSKVKEYLNSVDRSFRFTIKVPNSITLTHFYSHQNRGLLESNPYFLSKDLFFRFIDTISLILPQTGVLLFQFEYLNRQKMPNLLSFLNQLDLFFSNIPKNISMGIEIRNPSYLNMSYFHFLTQHHLQHVFMEGYHLPSIYSIYNQFRTAIQSPVIFRLHGNERKKIEKQSGLFWNRIWISKDNQLRSIAAAASQILSDKLTLYINVNNHFEGSAPLTINRLNNLMSSGDLADV